MSRVARGNYWGISLNNSEYREGPGHEKHPKCRIYEETGRLFSPHYRQMSINAYNLPGTEREKAKQIAYPLAGALRKK